MTDNERTLFNILDDLLCFMIQSEVCFIKISSDAILTTFYIYNSFMEQVRSSTVKKAINDLLRYVDTVPISGIMLSDDTSKVITKKIININRTTLIEKEFTEDRVATITLRNLETILDSLLLDDLYIIEKIEFLTIVSSYLEEMRRLKDVQFMLKSGISKLISKINLSLSILQLKLSK